MHKFPELGIDVRSVVRKFGGRAALHFALKKRGVLIPVRTIDAWIRNDSIPMDHFLQLWFMAKAQEWSLKLNDFITIDGEKKLSKYLQKKYESNRRDSGEDFEP